MKMVGFDRESFLRDLGKEPKADKGEGYEPDREEKPGAKGRILVAALKNGDGEAIEEAVKAICEYEDND